MPDQRERDHLGRPLHGLTPGFGRTVTPDTGFYIGFISELPDDSEGEQLLEFSGTVFPEEEMAREEWADAQDWHPGWRVYQLTDITERKPQEPFVISHPAALDALPELTPVIDESRDVFQKRGGLWCGYECAPITSKQLLKYGRITVLRAGGGRA